MAGGFKHFWAIYINCRLNSISCSSSNREMSEYSLHNLHSCPIVPCSLLVSSGYSIFRQSRNWFQGPVSNSGKLDHWLAISVTNFIRPYLHQFFNDSHSLNGYRKPLKRPFDQYQSRLEAISIGQDIRQINW